MEFPNLGAHCSMSTCRQLDFLPVKCDACGKVFCNDHYSYRAHECPNAAQRDVQVPICPLCGIAVPVKRGEQPDIKMSEHIDNNCTSDVALSRKKVYANRCSIKGCKRKEIVPVVCPECNQNFCLTHRHRQDHNCTGSGSRNPRGNASGMAGYAAVARANQAKRDGNTQVGARQPMLGTGARPERSGIAASTRMGAYQGGMTEDEALARALRLSLAEGDTDAFGPSNTNPSQTEEDEMLARALAASEREARRQGILANTPASNSNKNCSLS